MAKKLAALNAARQQEQMWRHIVDHNHPPGAPVNFAELPAVKPKIPNNKASLGEMCKRVRILREWAHRMQLNHIPLMGLEVASEQLPPTDASPSAEGSSRDLMTKFLAGLTAFQEKYGTYANTGRMRAHPAGPGEGNPSENPSSEPLPGLDGGSDVPGGVGIAAGITDEDHA